MIHKILFALFAGLAATAVAGDRSKEPSVIHLDHATVADAFVRGVPLLTNSAYKVQAGRRTGPGEVEIHEHDTDIFYVLKGSATFVTGGKVVEPRSAGPGETRAKAITGGEERHLTKGDIIVIPTGVPHWFKTVNGTFLYYVVKVTRP
jgi:quercetin dioxygenase-like cupin family protein